MLNFIYSMLQTVFTFLLVRRLEAARRRFQHRSAALLETLSKLQGTEDESVKLALSKEGMKRSAEARQADVEVNRIIETIHRRRCIALSIATAICKAWITLRYWTKRMFWAPLDFIRR